MSNIGEIILKRVLFWFDAPPNITKGVFNEFSNKWAEETFYICKRDFTEERKKTNWGNDNNARANVVMLNEHEKPDEKAYEIIDNFNNDIHVFPGFISLKKYLKYFKKKYGVESNVIIYTEIPNMNGNLHTRIIKSLINPIRFRYYYLKYNNMVKIILPLGQKGVQRFKKYGWDHSKIYPFMYCPEYNIPNKNYQHKYSNNKVNFLYVGRFSYQTRGLDILMKSFNKLTNDNWSLDLVGGYGDKKNEVITWAQNKKNVNFLGTWPTEIVGSKMRNYDVCLVPTKVDGWNVQINEAIYSGIGVITTTSAISDEMISQSKAGQVVKSNNIYEFSEALLKVIENPILTKEWKEKAKKYRHKILPETVANYLKTIVEFEFFDNTSIMKPSCPWIGSSNE